MQRVADNSWSEGTLTYDSAPAFGPALVTMPQSSRDGTIGANVTTAVRTATGGIVSFALTNTAASPASYHAKEGGQPPRLILVVPQSLTSVSDARPGTGIGTIAPNPSAGIARIIFEMTTPQAATLAVYSIDGRLVRTLATGRWSAGRHEATWDGLDARGRVAPAGVYRVRLANGGRSLSRTIVRVR